MGGNSADAITPDVMDINRDLTAAAEYLLQNVEPELAAKPAHEILAKNAPRIRDLIRRWWATLEPEATAGVSVQMMEEALVRIAQRAALAPSQMVGRSWARGLNWTTRLLQID